VPLPGEPSRTLQAHTGELDLDLDPRLAGSIDARNRSLTRSRDHRALGGLSVQLTTYQGNPTYTEAADTHLGA
jgi:hypothetical protein